MELIDHFLAWCREELQQAQKIVADIESGRLKTHARTADGPLVDTTDESLAHAKRTIKELSEILAQQDAKRGA